MKLGSRGGGGTGQEGEDSLHSQTDRIKSSRKSETYKGSEELHPRLESGAGESPHQSSVVL